MSATWAMGKALSEQSCHAVHGRHLEQVPPASSSTRALQAYLGHKNIQDIVRYTEFSPGRKDFLRRRSAGEKFLKDSAIARSARALNDLLWGGK